jgi:hypothetical protein
VAIVPTGATTGNVVVTVAGSASNGKSFTVLAAPSITSLSPTSGAVSASVTIAGANFGATQATSTIKFNGTTATATEPEVWTIMGPPSSSPTGDVLVAECGQVGAASVLVYDFVPAGWFERWAATIIGSHPQIDRLIVCFDASHTVVKKDVLMVTID